MQTQRPSVGSWNRITQMFSGALESWKRQRDRAVQLHIDPNVKPVAQPMRRTPFSMRSTLEEKIKELIELDIIEPAQGPTPWVNPIVVVPKSGCDIRLCINMRRTNEAIRRARHPTPTVDDITQSITARYSPNLTLSGDTTSLNFPQNPERLLRLLPTTICSDTRDYCLVLTLLRSSISTRSRRHLGV